MRAQKAFLGGKNHLAMKEKERETIHPSTSKPAAKESESETEKTQEISSETIYRVEPKVGRNDSCPCGSGKKYKKCCLQ